MGPLMPWYRLTQFQIDVINAWERGDRRALSRLAEYKNLVAVGV